MFLVYGVATGCDLVREESVLPFFIYYIVPANIISLEILEVVSRIMMLAYKLDSNIDGNKLLNDIQKLIHKSNLTPDKEYLLIIKIVSIDYNDTAAIPKLTSEGLEKD